MTSATVQVRAAQHMSPSWLLAAQAARVFPDSKTLVDCPLAASPSEVAAAFQQLQRELPDVAARPHEPPHRAALESFCARWLLPPGSDLAPAPLPQLGAAPPPGWLPGVQQAEIRRWAEHLHRSWAELCRVLSAQQFGSPAKWLLANTQLQASPDVSAHPNRHSLLTPAPEETSRAFVVPGARFRECYYWDTFWTLRGLLVCGLTELAQDTLSVLLSTVERYGFMPNGLRTYYLNRSQPPLLSQMVAAVHAAAPSAALLRRALAALRREHAFWTAPPKQVLVRGPGGRYHALSRYYADWDQPRPESYREDVETAAGLDEAAAAQLWRELASAAESGWDFSSRWLADGARLNSCRTTLVVPADLNALLYQMERNISAFAAELEDAELARAYAEHAERRLDAINELLWDASTGQWRDLALDREQLLPQQAGHAGQAQRTQQAGLERAEPPQQAERAGQAEGQEGRPQHEQQQQRAEQQPPPQRGAGSDGSDAGGATPGGADCGVWTCYRQSGVVAASNWVPLYCGCAPAGGGQALAALASLQRSDLLQPAGVAVSLCETGQQWDWPNSWPPLTCMLLEGCAEHCGEAGQQLAARLAQQYLETAHAGWERSGHMWEKFDATQAGAAGGGGEYQVVWGFGWTCGVALLLLEMYGWRPGVEGPPMGGG